MTIRELATWQADLAFFASEIAAVVEEMKKREVNAIEIESYLTIRDGIRRISPGLSKIRYLMIRAFDELGVSMTPTIATEIKKVAETVEKFKKGKKDGN